MNSESENPEKDEKHIYYMECLWHNLEQSKMWLQKEGVTTIDIMMRISEDMTSREKEILKLMLFDDSPLKTPSPAEGLKTPGAPEKPERHPVDRTNQRIISFHLDSDPSSDRVDQSNC